MANSTADIYEQTRNLGETQPQINLGERLRRWDQRMGTVYAGLANRRLNRMLTVVGATFLLIVLAIGKWQVFKMLLGANPDIHEPAAWAPIFNQIVQLPFIVLELLLIIAHRPTRMGVARFSAIPVALAGTVAPLFLALNSWNGAHATLTFLGSILLLLSMGWLIWSLATLGRCFSIMPEVRGLITSGPYQWVRHPVYLGEIAATLGLLLPALTASNIAIFSFFCVLQLWRTRFEESNLVANFPQYDTYRQRTARLLPGLW